MLLRKLFSCFLTILFISNSVVGQDCPDSELELSVIQFNLNSCTALSNGSDTDYREFKGLSSNKSDCANMSVIGNGGALYRLDPRENSHSCTPGVDGTAGMCVSAEESCSFRSDSELAVRFDVELVPGVDFAQFKSLSFYEKAPINYNWIDGDIGKNNYPTKYGVRVTSEGREIYRNTELPTGNDWTLQTLDLSFFSGFVVDKPTVFSFELLAYCPVGNGANLSVWDIDQIKLEGGCLNAINGGMVSVNGEQSVTTCTGDGITDNIDPAVSFSKGDRKRWIITDEDGNILELPASAPFNFEDAGEGVCLIWNVSYMDDLSGLTVGQNIDGLTGCFDLSNPVTINREGISVATIYIEDGNDEVDMVTLCTNDGRDDFVSVGSRNSGSTTDNRDWVITDDRGVILNADASPPFNFEGIDAGNCLIWQVSYRDGLVGKSEGENIADLEGCFMVSNSVTVIRNQPLAGTISFDRSDENELGICSGDGQSDMIRFRVTGDAGDDMAWIVTTAGGTIISVSDDPSYDFEGGTSGDFIVRHLSYIGDIFGLTEGGNVNDIVGCYNLSNELVIDSEGVRGTAIFIEDGSDELEDITLCTNDGVDDLVFVGSRSTGGGAANRDWVITDESGVILDADASEPFNFEGVEEGTCLIWQVSYQDGLEGKTAGENISDLEGCFLVSNSLSVFRNQPQGGTISFASTADEEIEICVGDGLSDNLAFRLSGANGSQGFWVVTSTNGRILSVSQERSFDFESDQVGTYIVRHISADEEVLNLEVGNLLEDVAGCLSSSNELTVRRNSVDAGTITTTNGLTETGICIESGQSNQIDIVLDDNRDIRSSNAWLITSPSGEILDLPSRPPFDFSNAEGGANLIWHLSYNEIDGLEVGENAQDLSGCFELSNSVTVNIGVSVGGTITGGPYLFCVGDGDSNFIPRGDINLGGASGTNSQWVITDDRGEILGLPDRPSDVNFDEAPEGVCLVWHLSYEDGIEGLEVGNNATRDLEGCYGLSNSIEVTRTSVVGGDLEGGPFNFCVGDGEIDTIVREDLQLFRWRGANRIWFVTDIDGNILDTPVRPSLVNFDNAAPGTCLIWHASYEGDIEGTEVGDNINDIEGCFDLSNSVEVIRGGVGETVLEGGPFSFCVGDGEADMISSSDLSITRTSGPGAQWVITDNNGDILGLPERASDVNFDDVAEGTCLVYFVNYSGEITALAEGENIGNLAGCFSLSNAVTVNRLSANGGELEGGPFSFCVGDGIEDRISEDDINIFGRDGESRRWLVTDESGTILEIPINPSMVNFDDAPAGICLLWHLSFSGEITGLEVGLNANDLGGCHDLSNAITIVRGGAGDIVLEGGPFSFCVGDGTPDMLSEGDLSVSTPSGDNAQWVITDADGSIVGLPANPTDVNFDDVAEGTCLIWFVSFSGDITGLELGSNINTDLDGCLSVSNSVTVNRGTANGGELTGGPFNFCIGDGIDDFIDDDEITLVGRDGDSRRWLVTDPTGKILALPVRPSLVNFEDAGSGTCLIWHLGFSGELTGLEVGGNAFALRGCFNLSNPISVFRINPQGGTISGGPFSFCVGDDVADNIPAGSITIADNAGSNTQWIITDESGEILGLPDDPSEVDFDTAPNGVCLIWHLSYEGDVLNLEVGNNANEIEGCFGLSNSISVTRTQISGGAISGGPFNFCVGDSIPDNIATGDVVLVDNSATNSQWVITDESGNILGLPGELSDVNFDDAPVGVCLVWHLSYEDGITGLAEGANAQDLSGCFELSNPISVNRNQPLGGTIIGGPFEFCVGDTLADNVSVSLMGNQGSNFQWVITDEAGNILDLPADIATVDFNDVEAGVCLIWHLSFEEGLEGAAVGNNASDLQGCYSLSNSITVTRKSGVDCLPPCEVDGGTLTGGPFMFCVGNEIRDTIPAGAITLDSISGPNQQWVITDTEGMILGLPGDPSEVDFDVAGVGECLIWNLTFEDGLTGAAVGNNANQLEGCFDLSNPISVVRSRPQGGTLMPDSFEFCVGDGTPDMIPDSTLVLVDNEGASSFLIVTDIAGTILSLPTNISEVNFDDAPAGECLIWNLSHTGEITGADAGSNVDNIMGCYSLSNAVTVIRSTPLGGVLSGGPFEFCVGDSIPDNIPMGAVMVTGAEGDSSQWIVTDTLGNILGLPPMPSAVDFDDAPAGSCLVWHMSYTGSISGLEVGQNVDNLSGCINISNSVLVNRKTGDDCADPCVITASTIAGGPYTFCVGDSIADNIPVGDITLMADSMANTQWVVTDTLGNIIGLPANPSDVNFDVAGSGVCLIWNITYQDSTTVFMMGANASGLGGCYALSNSITVNRNQPAGGTLTGGPFTFCVGDSIPDNIAEGEIVLTGNTGISQWVVTDTLGNILGLPATPSDVNFDDAPVGVCLVWHLSFVDSLGGAEVGLNANDITGCFSLSNPITVNRNQPMGGTISGGPFEFCVGDSIADMIPMGAVTVSGNTGSNSQWVVTDDLGNILGLPASPSDVNFEDAPEGICFLWHLSFEDGLTGAVVDSSANNLAGCFSLSNSIEIVRNSGEDCAELCMATPNTLRGGPFTFCVGDSIADNIPVDGITLTQGDSLFSHQWVITDTAGIILGLPNMVSDVDFDDAGAATCLVWNIAYKDSTTVFTAGANANNLGGCYALSNSIEVIRSQPQGGMLTGGPFEFCVGDSIPDNIPAGGITVTGNVGGNSQWVVTDTAGIILGLPADPSAVDFDDAGTGTCLVWHLSFEDGLTGAAEGNHTDSLSGCFSLSNPIMVNRNQPVGGMLTGGPFTFCVGDGIADFVPADSITLSGNSASSNSQWVVTDTLGTILTLPANYTEPNFENAPAGACLIWHLSFEGILLGGEVGMSADSLEGCFSLSNPIRINRLSGDDCPVEVCEAVGGTITGGPFEFCVGDGIVDTIAIGAITIDSASGDFSQWVVTDDSGVILGLPEDPSSVNFDIAPAGICVIQHLSGVGTIGSLEIGANLLTDVTGCYMLSNSITVTRTFVDNCKVCEATGGRLVAADFEFCSGDSGTNTIDSSQIVLVGNSGTSQKWIISDTLNNILGTPQDITSVDFGIVDPGVYLIRVVSHEEDLQNLESGNNLSELTGCFALSTSFSVTVVDPQGGTLAGGPFFFCVGDGLPDNLTQEINLSGATGTINQWVVTDKNLNILGIPFNISDIDFDTEIPDTCLVWNLSASGNVDGLLADLNLNDVTGCYGLSNSLSVIRVTGDDCLGVLGFPVINEVTDNDRVEILNIGASPIDVGNYWLCNRPSYDRINSLTIECGGDDYIINPGEVLTLVLDNISISGQMGEVGLYSSSRFAFSDAIVDYVQWGSANNGRASVAVGAGIWTEGDFVPTFGLGSSISYDGEGNASTDWAETTPNLCAENGLVADPHEKLSINVFPVPASSQINFDLNHDVDEVHKVAIYDNYGHALYQTTMESNEDFQLNVNNLKAGIYYLKVKTGRYSGVQRFVIVN